MKTKRLIISALVLLSLGITACNNQPAPDGGSSNTPSQSSNDGGSDSSGQAQGHVHTFGVAWRTNETHHWHVCTGTLEDGSACTERSDYAEHTWDNGTVVTPAGATTPGQMKYMCTACKRARFEEIEPAGGQDAYKEGEDENHVPIYNFHTELQRQYLADTWDSILTYIPKVNAEDRQQHPDLSVPTAITLDCSGVETASKYYIQLADNSSFTNAKQYESTSKFYNVYNTKLGTQYYYRAATSEAGLSSATVKTFKVSTQAPRNVRVDGVINFRDCGGWSSSLVPNGVVKQGMYYRCAQFDDKDNKSKVNITEEGRATIKELGIKVDIDMRDSNQVPSASPASSAGWTVELLKASVASGTENYRWEGKQNSDTSIGQTYKKIFEAIAVADQKPIALHCTPGADRTGIVSWFLLGLLGVSKEDCARDYVMTRFAGERAVLPSGSGSELEKWNSKTEALAGATWADKTYKHLNEDFGISVNTLETIREKFVPGYTRG